MATERKKLPERLRANMTALRDEERTMAQEILQAEQESVAAFEASRLANERVERLHEASLQRSEEIEQRRSELAVMLSKSAEEVEQQSLDIEALLAATAPRVDAAPIDDAARVVTPSGGEASNSNPVQKGGVNLAFPIGAGFKEIQHITARSGSTTSGTSPEPTFRSKASTRAPDRKGWEFAKNPANFIPSFTHIVLHPNGKWYKLSCPECHGNASKNSWRSFLNGAKAFHDHLTRVHPAKVIGGGLKELIAACQTREVSLEEVRKLRESSADAPQIRKVYVQRRKSGIFSVKDTEVGTASTIGRILDTTNLGRRKEKPFGEPARVKRRRTRESDFVDLVD